MTSLIIHRIEFSGNIEQFVETVTYLIASSLTQFLILGSFRWPWPVIQSKKYAFLCPDLNVNDYIYLWK